MEPTDVCNTMFAVCNVTYKLLSIATILFHVHMSFYLYRSAGVKRLLHTVTTAGRGNV